jgi:hypothetical protein
MIRAEIIEFNKELLQRLKEAGVKLEDYRYCDLYRDYTEMSRTERNRKVVFLTLAERYGISDRQVYNIVNHMKAIV